MIKRSFFIYIILLGCLLASCGSTRDITYFQDAKKFEKFVALLDSAHYEIRIKPNDNLLITVASRNPIAVEEFNSVSFERGSISTSSLDWRGYLVDEAGYINFPQFGKIYVQGMSKDELIQLLEKQIKTFYDDPIVNVRFLNYKVTVLGEVSRPGVYTVNDEKITIPQALALAGDLTIYGKREDVLVYREENGQKTFFTLDLKDPMVFASPYYYLRQNDVIYVSPNSAQASRSSYSQSWSVIISITSLLFTIGTFVYTSTK